MDMTTDQEYSTIKQVGLWAGPLVFFLMLLTSGSQDTMPREAWLVAGVGIWMATWWSTEAIPVAATAFIPLVSFPLLQVMPVKAVAQSYAHPTIFLFMGAFVLALAVEKWSLHRRIALTVLSKTGTDGRKLILGFMVAAALLSMWMTNTSTAMMLLPIAASVAAMVAEKSVGVSSADKRRFQVALLLALAYATTIGGMSTIIGTPPNVLLAGFVEETYGRQIAFFDWMLIGLPLALVLLPLGWLVLTRVAFRVDIPASREAAEVIRDMRLEMGVMSAPERRVGLVFLTVVALWMSRKWLNTVSGLEGLSDAGIVMAAALLIVVWRVASVFRRAIDATFELWLKQSPNRRLNFSVDDDGIVVSLEKGSSRYSWGDFRRVWRYSDVWILEIVKNRSVLFPIREAPAEMANYMVDRLRAAHVRV